MKNKKLIKKEDSSKEEITFDEMYEAITYGLIHGDDKERDRIWKLLNEAKGDLVWIKMKIIVECYEHADAKGKEEFCLLGAEDHLEDGSMIQLKDNFIDNETNIEYRQYKFTNGLTYRIPIVTDGMDKTTFKEALNKKFLGDYIEYHIAGTGMMELIYLDTQEKVDDWNKNHSYYTRHPLYQGVEPIKFDPTKDKI